MSDEVIVSFTGPFSWPGTPDAPSVFDVEEGRLAGIYLWTVSQHDGYLIYYVGETGRRFSTRLLEHYTEHAAAMYHVYSPAVVRPRRENRPVAGALRRFGSQVCKGKNGGRC